ncbi:MAG TPA: nucleotidyltransferase [Chitinophagales bacterium]|jgi:hypothetical protein|nr:nucleotidyltransferase [Chitinophagales bacterium]
MNNIFNDDFQDFLKAFNKNEVNYILVGGYSVIVYGYSRTTGDMDLWVEKTRENYAKIVKSFSDFGMSLFDMTESEFLKDNLDVFTFGRTPVRIDILTALKGLEFNTAYQKSEIHHLDQIPIRVIHFEHLIASKKAAGRFKDLDDIEQLEGKN